MARAAGLWLAAVLCFYIYITTTRIDGFPQGSIIRAKRDLDENFEDALFEKEEGLLSKREAKDADEDKDSSGNKAEEPAVTSDSTKKSDTGDKVTIDSEESVEEGSENAEDSPANKDEKPKKSDAEDQKAETRHNVEGVPDLQNYINGAVGPDAAAAAQESQQEQADIERGVAPQQDASMVESASPEKEEDMGTFENTQAFQPVMPVPVQAYTGSNQNIFGPMVPVTPGAYPMPGANDGYGGNQAVRSEVPDDDDEEGNKKSAFGLRNFTMFAV